MNDKTVTYPIDGLTRDEAIIALVATHKLSLKDAKAYYKANKPAPTASWKEAFYAELGSAPMDEARFDEVVAEGSDNIVAHKSAHKMVWECAQAIWTSVEASDDEETDEVE